MEGEDVELVREPDNKYDSNAIRVDSDQGRLGYIPAQTAATLAPFMDRGNSVDAFIEAITGGTEDKPTMGVVLHIRKQPRSHYTTPAFVEPEGNGFDLEDAHDALGGCFPAVTGIAGLIAVMLIATMC